MKEELFTNGKKIELTIESIAASGSGVGFIQEKGFTRPVFVRYTAPGDIVLVQLTRKYKRYYEAELCKILTPSKHRIEPVCPHFGVCGACDFLHITYEEQLRSKEQILLQTLKKFSVIHPKILLIGAKEQLQYRKKARVFVQDGVVGFSQKKSNDIVPIKHCDILHEPLNTIFSNPPSTNGEHVFAFDEQTKKVIAKEIGFYTVEESRLAFHPKGFVQSNFSMNKELVHHVLSLIPSGTVLELYAGNGNFSIPLAKKGNSVVAVEGDSRGFELLCTNAKTHEVTMRAVQQDVREFLKENTLSFDTILLDPARTGALEILPFLNAKTLVYVSCNAQTLGKELAQLCKQGYRLTSLTLLDLFPQTRHFETVVSLQKENQ